MRKGALSPGRHFAIALGLALSLATGCTKEHRLPDTSGSVGSSGAATLSSIQSDIFRLSCATSGCHDNRATPAGSLDLTTVSKSYAGMVNHLSSQATGVMIVAPGDVDHSYLLNKLHDTQNLAGGSGTRMPQYAAALSDDQIARIRDWIANGAPLN